MLFSSSVAGRRWFNGEPVVRRVSGNLTTAHIQTKRQNKVWAFPKHHMVKKASLCLKKHHWGQ